MLSHKVEKWFAPIMNITQTFFFYSLMPVDSFLETNVESGLINHQSFRIRNTGCTPPPLPVRKPTSWANNFVEVSGGLRIHTIYITNQFHITLLLGVGVKSVSRVDCEQQGENLLGLLPQLRPRIRAPYPLACGAVPGVKSGAVEDTMSSRCTPPPPCRRYNFLL